MQVIIKPFSRGSVAIRLAYGKVEHGQFTPINDLRKASNFSDIASRQTSGKFGTPSYTEEYEIDLSKLEDMVLAVQKWEGISSTHPQKVWEIIHGK